MKNCIFYIQESEVEPLGAMYLIAKLKQLKWNVIIEFINGNKKIEEATINNDVNIALFSIVSGNHSFFLELAKRYKDSGIISIIGGPYVTFFPDGLEIYADYCVIGDGVSAIEKILENNNKIKKGIIKSSEINVSQYDLPDREELYKYDFKRNQKIKNIIASSGCPFSCSFCYNNLYKKLYSEKVHIRSVDSIISEAKQIKFLGKTEMIFFQDDNFMFSMSWMKEFKTKWKEYIDLPFHCQIRLDSINDKKLNILKSAGCTGVSVGIECANESYRINYLNRKLSNYKIIEKCNLIKSKGLKLRAYVMIGLPFTTIDDDLDTLSFIHNIQPTSVRSAIYYPLKGTVLGNSCYESNLISIDRVKSIEKLPFNNLSVLNFNNDRLTQIQFLQKLFQLFVFIPEPVKLFKSIFENSKDISSNDMNINNIADFGEFLKRHLYDNILYA